MTIEYLHYVRHHNVEEYLGLGWSISDFLDGTPHGQYAVLMQWDGEGEPRTPLSNINDGHNADGGLPV
jgi:hypothetical protein